jgi:hypothetical protein
MAPSMNPITEKQAVQAETEAKGNGHGHGHSHVYAESDRASIRSAPVDTVVNLKHRINVWSALGVNFSATCAPIAALTFLSVTIGQGGSPIFLYSYLVAVVMNMTVCVSLAEMASAKPHSSGKSLPLFLPGDP